MKYAGYKQTKAGVKKATNETHKISSGEVDLEEDQYKVLSRAFSSMAWSFGDSDGPPAMENASGSNSKMKQIENQGLTNTMKELLADAKSAQERLHQQAMRYLTKRKTSKSSSQWL